MMLLVASRAAPCTGPVLGMNIPGSNQSLLSEILSETCKLPVTIVFDTAVLYSGNASNADNFISGCQVSRELIAVPFIKVRREPPRSTRKSTDIKIEFKTMSPDIIKSRGKSAPVSTSNNGDKNNLGVEDDNGSIESNLIAQCSRLGPLEYKTTKSTLVKAMDSKCGADLDRSLGLGLSKKKTNISIAESILDVVVHVEDTAQGTTHLELLNTSAKGIAVNGSCFVSENETLAGTSMEYTTFLEFLEKSSTMSKNGRENYKQLRQVTKILLVQ